MAKNEFENENMCLMAIETEVEGDLDVEQELKSDVVNVCSETVVTTEVTPVIEEKAVDEKISPTDPWNTNECEEECDCALVAATKVSSEILKDLCTDKCIIAFANIKMVNENLRNKILEE